MKKIKKSFNGVTGFFCLDEKKTPDICEIVNFVKFSNLIQCKQGSKGTGIDYGEASIKKVQ